MEDRYDVEDERKQASIVGIYVISESTARSAVLIARCTYPGCLRGRRIARIPILLERGILKDGRTERQSMCHSAQHEWVE